MISLSLLTGEANAISRSDGEDIGLQIVGTIAHSSQQEGVALIKEKESGRVLAVKKGFKVLMDFEVVEVRPKYVLLKKAENYHLVFQSKFASEFIVKDAPASTTSAGKFQEPGFERNDNTVRMTAEYRDKIIKKDLSNVLMQATAVPIVNNGKIQGFQLLQIDQGSIYDKAGFTNEDIITAINGKQLGSVAGAIQLLNSLREEERIEVSLIRKGVEQTIDVSVQ